MDNEEIPGIIAEMTAEQARRALLALAARFPHPAVAAITDALAEVPR